MAGGYSPEHIPLRVRRVPDLDRCSVDAFLASCVRRFGPKPWSNHGRPAAAPAEMPVVRPLDWVVEDSDWWYRGPESAREWSELARFESQEDAANFCRRIRQAERRNEIVGRVADEYDRYGDVP